MNKIEKFIHLNYEELIEDCFGQWIGFWYGDANFTLEETKEVFFQTLKKLLDDDLVVLFPPYTMFNTKISRWDKTKTTIKYGQTIWGLPNDKIIEYIKSVFPKDIKDENDLKLTNFWYSEDCPQIGWIDQETGKISG
ncbi:hypothetical protein CRYPA_508 [uncultured Candidatus Thioglobus sp.]|nr:hypothetical protein CRYPA_508 [uncultured Candidatus Thioglobus sp.]